jgi:outer membrane receptor protein involved in Fe transport
VELRGPVILISIFFIFTSNAVNAEPTTLRPTEVTDTSIDELGARKTTRPTETISNEELQTEMRPFSDGLNTLPGVQVRLNGSPTISIRGSQSSARTLVFADGAPLNFSDGAGFNPIFIANENLDHVTLLRGPASTLFGHDALAGALEFETEKLLKPKFYSSYGSFNTSQVFAGTPFKALGSSTQVTAYQTHSDGNYNYTTQTGFAGLRARNDQETSRATLTSQWNSDKVHVKSFNLIARQIGSTPGALDFPSISSFNNWAELSYLGFNFDASETFQIATRSTYKYIHQDYQNFGSPTDTDSFHQGLSLIKKLGAHQVEIFGDTYFEQFNASYLGTGQESDVLAEFGVSDFFSPVEQLTIQPAMRFSNENGGIVPSIGVIGTTDNQIKLFANYSEGFHPPSITQKFSQTPQFVGNPNLTAEHSTELDAGVERTFLAITGKLEIFNRDIYNAFATGLSGTTPTTINVGHTHAQGAELSFEQKHLGLSMSYLNNILIDTNSPVPLSPRVQASVHGSQTFGLITGTLQDTYWSDYYDISTSTGGLVDLYSWNTLDLFLSAQVMKNITAKIAVLNILNQPRELTLNYPEPQRSFQVMIQGYL